MDYIFECLALYRAHKVRTVIPMQSGGNVGGLCAQTVLKCPIIPLDKMGRLCYNLIVIYDVEQLVI